MTAFHSDTETEYSDGEPIYSDSDISSDESMHTSNFIDDSDASIEDETESSTEDETESSTEDESDDEYIPHKRQKMDSSELTIVNVSVSSS